MANYIKDFEQAEKLFATARFPSKGKPLTSGGYLRLFKKDDNTFIIGHKTWEGIEQPDKTWKSITGFTPIYSIESDNTVTLLFETTPVIDSQCSSNIVITCRGAPLLWQARFNSSLLHPGYFIGESPLFKGFKVRGKEILTPVVPEIEEKLAVRRKECLAKCKELNKKLRLIAKFDVFKYGRDLLDKDPEWTDWKNRPAVTLKYDLFSINFENMDEVSKFLAMCPGFTRFGTSNVGHAYTWSRGHYEHSTNYDVSIPNTLKHASMRHLSLYRDTLYKEWYNKGNSNT